MNKKLTEEIIKHVFSSLGIIPSEFVNLDNSESLINKKYLLPVTISFEEVETKKPTGQVWGCQLSVDQQEVKILLGNYRTTDDLYEYALLIQLKDAPCYGLFLTTDSNMGVNIEPMIACSVNGKEWIECNTFLQASFLAGMEQLKESGLAWSKCSSHDEEFKKLTSFTDYHFLVYEAQYEREEG